MARRGGLVGAVAAGALMLGACGTGTPSGSGGTTSTAGPTGPSTTSTTGSGTTGSGTTGGGTTATTSPPTSSSVAGDASAAIARALQNGENATFDASYKIVGNSSASSFEIVTESASKFAWTVTDSSGTKTEFIANGTAAWVCQVPASGAASCVQYPASQVSSLSAAYAVFTGKYWYDAVTAIKQYAGLSGFHESTSSGTYAGQSANCVTWTGGAAGTAGQGGTVCVTTSGVLAYAKANDAANSITLQSLSSSVSGSSFQPPAGAHMVAG